MDIDFLLASSFGKYLSAWKEIGSIRGEGDAQKAVEVDLRPVSHAMHAASIENNLINTIAAVKHTMSPLNFSPHNPKIGR